MHKPVILTGFRANNNLHIGNYFGALLPMADMARNRSSEFQVNIFVPDLHSFTTEIDYSQLQNQIMRTLKAYVAAGLTLDNPDVHIYRQSYIPAHSEMTWILNCFTSFGQLNRMTQFKDKSSKLSEDKITAGLFNYPVLMAADILLYNAEYIPVGDDQTQHLEFTRDIAERMNSRFGELFVVPKPVSKQHEFFGKDQGLRIKNLQDPSKKMSKSDESDKGVIFLTDNPEEAAKKIMSAATDDLASVNYDPANQPGISNLIDILALLRGSAREEVASQFSGQSSYGDFKSTIASEMAQFLQNFQATLSDVNEEHVISKLEQSESAMNNQANHTLYKVQKAVGLR